MKQARFTPRARRDIIGIRDWIERDNAPRATSFVEEISDHCRRLAERALIGRARPDMGLSVRSTPHGNFLIFYQPTAIGVDVLRVVHGRRDLRRGLK